MLELLSDLVELIEWLINGFAGWRYLGSTTYRKQTHLRWKEIGRVRATFEIVAGLSGIIFTLLIVGFIGYLIFCGQSK